MKTLSAVFCVSLIMICLVSHTKGQNLVVNPGFETGNFTGWTQSGGGSSSVGNVPHSGNFGAILAGTNIGFLTQNLDTVPGASYDLTFWLAQPSEGTIPANHFEASWNGSIIAASVLNNVPAFGYKRFTFCGLKATSATTSLQFGFNQGGFAYYALDDISVTVVSEPPTPVTIVSTKVHGNAGPFPIDLPLDGSGIECRSGGVTGDYQIVFSFAGPVTVNGNPQAEITSGVGDVGSGGVADPNGTVSVAGSNVTVPLTNVPNEQTIVVTLFCVDDGTNTGAVAISMSVLIGDTTGNGSVNSSDVSQTKSKSGQPVDASNFRTDVTVNALINSSDVSLVKSKSGTALP